MKRKEFSHNNTSSYTKINHIFDEMILHCTGAEFKLLYLIARQTWGWQKDNDWISISQFVQLTGLSRRQVIYSIQSLLDKGMITRDDKRKYAINVEWATKPKGTEQPCIKQRMLSSNSFVIPIQHKDISRILQGGAKIALGGAKNAPTKETNTKEIYFLRKKVTKNNVQAQTFAEKYLFREDSYTFPVNNNVSLANEFS